MSITMKLTFSFTALFSRSNLISTPLMSWPSTKRIQTSGFKPLFPISLRISFMIELDKFSATFRDFSDDYCVIGGGAMLEIAKDYSLQPRATKDIDIIVFVKASTPSFIRKLALFAQEAAYRECSHSENFCSYRFSHPKDKTYPDQIELFCFDPVLGNELQHHLVHSTLGQGVSFSAILLDKDYYDFAQQHVLKSEISYLSEEAMIPLKAKAYLANKELWEEHADGASSANYRK